MSGPEAVWPLGTPAPIRPGLIPPTLPLRHHTAGQMMSKAMMAMNIPLRDFPTVWQDFKRFPIIQIRVDLDTETFTIEGWAEDVWRELKEA